MEISVGIDFNYRYDNKDKRFNKNLNKEYLFLSVLPEIRKSYKDIDIYANLGSVISTPLLSRDIILYQCGIGINAYIGSIALKLGLNHFSTKRVSIYEANSTNISFVNNGFVFGIVHTFGKKEM